MITARFLIFFKLPYTEHPGRTTLAYWPRYGNNLQPPTFNLQPPTFNLQPSTFNLQPFNLQPSTFNLQPFNPSTLQPFNPSEFVRSLP
ncbi:hypothetical protein BJP36_30795 [Moorena producens JHB]|uniref:Restriction endonuclease n=1 Tax=Moorena producens (strain JHB) TaxID=1454205 RepID=A0A1D9G7N4_MOOP1|nr:MULTISPECIES: hypothetical protein [Moorena]AOY83652.1 hypothetical protein BJP36_30795 [Moorena producens JHB]